LVAKGGYAWKCVLTTAIPAIPKKVGSTRRVRLIVDSSHSFSSHSFVHFSQQDTSRPAKGKRGTEKEKGEENQQ
jgi:hypothetical protein